MCDFCLHCCSDVPPDSGNGCAACDLAGILMALRDCSMQVGFFEIVAMPMFRSYVELIPGAQPLLDGVMANYEYWHGLQHV